MNSLCSILAAEVLTSLGGGLRDTWSGLLSGVCGLRTMTRLPRGRYQTDLAGEVPQDVDEEISAACLGSSSRCRAYRYARWVGERALTGLPPDQVASTGLVLATTKAGLDEFQRAVDTGEVRAPAMFEHAVFARVLASDLGVCGPTTAVSGACASGLVAMIQAARWVRRGDAESVLVIGVDALVEFVLAGFSSLRALSRGPCRPFDASREGLSLGEGAGAMLVGRAGPGRPALATIGGWGIASDANHITGPSRTGDGLAQALSGALDGSRLAPDDIGYINAHGTGTLHNDEMEAQAMTRVFDRVPPVFSLKGSLGHTLGAAGVIEAAVCVLAMREGLLPPTVGFERLGVTREIPVSSQARPVARARHAVTLKSGFGGVNAAVVLSADGESA